VNYDTELQAHFERLRPPINPAVMPAAKRAIEIMSEVCLGVRTRLDAHASFENSDDLTPSELCRGLHLDAFVASKCEEICRSNH